MTQSLQLGPAADGYAGAALLGAHRGVGTAVVVEPDGHGVEGASTLDTTATMPLDPTALLVSALGEDALQLRRRLDAALAACGPAWGSPTPERWSAVPR